MAKRDSHGNLITAPNSLKSLYIGTYQHRLRHRVIETKYEEIQSLKMELCHGVSVLRTYQALQIHDRAACDLSPLLPSSNDTSDANQQQEPHADHG